jgi:sugar lactone lactonase YvrE
MPNGTWPNSILVARNGIVWTVGTKSHTLISFDPKQGKIKSSYPIITSEEKIHTKNNTQSNQGFQMVWSIVEDNDGSIWFPEGGSDPLWRFDPHTEEFQVIHTISAAPMQMKVDHKTGNIWFTTFGSGTFGVIQKISTAGNHNSSNTNLNYKVTEFNLGNDSFPSGVFLQGGSVWITETLNQDRLVQFKPIVDANGIMVNVVKGLEIPSSSSTSPNQQKHMFTTPTDLVVFANNSNNARPSSIWLAEHGTSFITEYRIDSHKVIRFPTSSSFRQYTTLPYWIRAASVGTDGNSFWFNEHIGNRIALFNTTDKTLTEYEIPTRDPLNGYISNALTLAVDPNDSNKTWFTEFNHDKIGVVDRSPPIPFSINSLASPITVLSSSNNKEQKNATSIAATSNVEVTAIKSFSGSSTLNNSSHSPLFLHASSSMNPLGRFVNMTARFYPSPFIDLTKDASGIAQTHLILQRNDSNAISPGNYTVGISATNGAVSKSIFKGLVVKRLGEK